MAETANFTFFPSYLEAANELPEDLRSEFLVAIATYGVTGIEPEMSMFVRAVFKGVKPNIDQSRTKSLSGKTGGNTPKKKKGETNDDSDSESEPLKADSEVLESEIEVALLQGESALKQNEEPLKADSEVLESERKGKEKERSGEGDESERRRSTIAHSVQAPSERDSSKASQEVDSLFAKFWSEYPKKVAKPEALKVWRRLGVNPALFEAIMQGLTKWKRTSQWSNLEFVPYPATWLNRRGWEDHIPSTAQQPRGSSRQAPREESSSYYTPEELETQKRIQDEMNAKARAKEAAYTDEDILRLADQHMRIVGEIRFSQYMQERYNALLAKQEAAREAEQQTAAGGSEL